MTRKEMLRVIREGYLKQNKETVAELEARHRPHKLDHMPDYCLESYAKDYAKYLASLSLSIKDNALVS